MAVVLGGGRAGRVLRWVGGWADEMCVGAKPFFCRWGALPCRAAPCSAHICMHASPCPALHQLMHTPCQLQEPGTSSRPPSSGGPQRTVAHHSQKVNFDVHIETVWYRVALCLAEIALCSVCSGRGIHLCGQRYRAAAGHPVTRCCGSQMGKAGEG